MKRLDSFSASGGGLKRRILPASVEALKWSFAKIRSELTLRRNQKRLLFKLCSQQEEADFVFRLRCDGPIIQTTSISRNADKTSLWRSCCIRLSSLWYSVSMGKYCSALRQTLVQILSKSFTISMRIVFVVWFSTLRKIFVLFFLDKINCCIDCKHAVVAISIWLSVGVRVVAMDTWQCNRVCEV